MVDGRFNVVFELTRNLTCSKETQISRLKPRPVNTVAASLKKVFQLVFQQPAMRSKGHATLATSWNSIRRAQYLWCFMRVGMGQFGGESLPMLHTALDDEVSNTFSNTFGRLSIPQPPPNSRRHQSSPPHHIPNGKSLWLSQQHYHQPQPHLHTPATHIPGREAASSSSFSLPNHGEPKSIIFDGSPTLQPAHGQADGLPPTNPSMHVPLLSRSDRLGQHLAAVCLSQEGGFQDFGSHTRTQGTGDGHPSSGFAGLLQRNARWTKCIISPREKGSVSRVAASLEVVHGSISRDAAHWPQSYVCRGKSAHLEDETSTKGIAKQAKRPTYSLIQYLSQAANEVVALLNIWCLESLVCKYYPTPLDDLAAHAPRSSRYVVSGVSCAPCQRNRIPSLAMMSLPPYKAPSLGGTSQAACAKNSRQLGCAAFTSGASHHGTRHIYSPTPVQKNAPYHVKMLQLQRLCIT
ncbi:uncharacterized protein TRIREDRAFT_109648 [Trichoderma reesei QM6a]|uniref:Predicted protein n=2 Tax=Hypocrea jecorina TaxID=51453 RepID=G0RPS6_HYPJQ|nr:uncharacterized protein TRIREDRAFT_109648 [Trichoderma reesei QM6a]EGR46800.1 predicted protein [Trichoderma reesei QM6a]ETS00524.1 hypothetical protein M419DRAFT_83423 [Trichoderma reesei RUT C-30]